MEQERQGGMTKQIVITIELPDDVTAPDVTYQQVPAAVAPQAPQTTSSATVCPKHHKELKSGKFGLYCPSKDDSTANGWCAFKG